MYERILLVAEANRSRHVVIDRAVATLALSPSEVQIRVLVLVNPDSTDTLAENPAMYRGRQWFSNLTKPLDLLKVDYDIMVSWSTYFAASILYAARQFKASIIGVPADDRITDAELAMLRDPPCPLMFIRPGGSPVKRRCVLAALRPRREEDGQPNLNQDVIDFARRAAEKHQAALHLVLGTKGSDQPDLARLADRAQVPAEQIHRVPGAPDQAIRQAIADSGADLLVLGSRRRQGTTALRGGVIDRLLGSVTIDVLVVP